MWVGWGAWKPVSWLLIAMSVVEEISNNAASWWKGRKEGC